MHHGQWQGGLHDGVLRASVCDAPNAASGQRGCCSLRIVGQRFADEWRNVQDELRAFLHPGRCMWQFVCRPSC
jgi:hypothetical protein